MTGTVVDTYVKGGQRSVDIGSDTSSESSFERLITKRTQRLHYDRENLKYRLHRYINLRSIQKWTPPRHLNYILFADRLKSFATWPRRTERPTPVFGRS